MLRIVINETIGNTTYQHDFNNEANYKDTLICHGQLQLALASAFACPLEVYVERVIGTNQEYDCDELELVNIAEECEVNGWYQPI